MNYPSEGKRKARREAREKAGADLEARMSVLLDEGFPHRDAQQEVLLKKLILIYNADFGHLPTAEEIMLILGKWLEQQDRYKGDKELYPALGEMLKKLSEKVEEQGSPLLIG